MSRNCVVSGCNSTDYTNALFSFPKHNLLLLKKWMEQISAMDLVDVDLDNSFICEKHFDVDQMTTNYNSEIELLPDAVPTRFEDDINLNSCRFCMKNFTELNSPDQISIDDVIKQHFKDLMDTDLAENENLPGFCCRKCNEDLKNSVEFKSRVAKVQDRFVELLENKNPITIIKQEVEEIILDYVEPDPALKSEVNIKMENVLESVNPKSVVSTIKRSRKDRIGRKKGRPRKYFSKEDLKTKIPCTEPGCGKMMHRSSLGEHLSRIHHKESKYICDFDGRKYYRKSEIVSHMQTNHMSGGKTVKCYICNIEFPCREMVRDHLKKEHLDSEAEDPNPKSKNSCKYNSHFKCKDCGKKTVSMQTLKRHRILCHSDNPIEKLELEQRERPRKNYLSEKVCCPICGKKMVRRSLKNHRQRFHSQQSRKLICDLCGKEQFYKGEMIYHMKFNHMERVREKCSYCDFTCFGGTFMKEHIDIVHFNRGLVCELCGQTISNKYKLKAHIRVWHTNEKPYKCDYCDKAFATASRRSGHVRSCHKDDPSICNLCGKTFNSRENLKRHLRIYHGEKKVTCSFEGCQEKFINKSNMLIHLASHTGIRKWSCNYCPHTNATRCGLRRHLRDVHITLNLTCEVPGCNFTTGRKELYRKHVKSKHKDIGHENYQNLLQRIRDIPLPKTELD